MSYFYKRPSGYSEGLLFIEDFQKVFYIKIASKRTSTDLRPFEGFLSYLRIILLADLPKMSIKI